MDLRRLTKYPYQKQNNTCPLCRSKIDPSVSTPTTDSPTDLAALNDRWLALFHSVFGQGHEQGVRAGLGASGNTGQTSGTTGTGMGMGTGSATSTAEAGTGTGFTFQAMDDPAFIARASGGPLSGLFGLSNSSSTGTGSRQAPRQIEEEYSGMYS